MISEQSKRKKAEYDIYYSTSDFMHLGIPDFNFTKIIISKYNLHGHRGLDLACGTGWWTYLFHKEGIECYGLDISSTGVRKGKRRFGGIDLITGDALNLPFKYESFDFIFCSGLSLFGVEDLRSCKEMGNEFLRYLRKDGILIIICASNLSNSQGASSWINHTLYDWKKCLLDWNCDILGIYFTHRFFPMILKKYALTDFLTKILSIVFRTIHLKGLIVCVVKKVK